MGMLMDTAKARAERCCLPSFLLRPLFSFVVSEWENVLARIPKVLLSSEPETMVDKLAPVFHDLDGQLSRCVAW